MTELGKYNYAAIWLIQVYASEFKAWCATGQDYYYRRADALKALRGFDHAGVRYRVRRYTPEGIRKPEVSR